MPKAQGRITIRRRPKDGTPGTPGADSVNYYIVLSPNSITIKADGSVICNANNITAKAYKNVGGVTSEANDGGMRLVYTKMDGTISHIAVSEVTSAAAATYAAVSFEYRINNKVVASEALVINREGQPGMDAVTIVVSPENVEFNYSTSVPRRVVKIDVYIGNKKLKYNDEYLCSTLGEGMSKPITSGLTWGAGTDDSDGFYYYFRYVAGNDVNIDIPFTVTAGGKKYEKIICVHTVKDGTPGLQGLQGCIYRRSKFATGFMFRNDSELETAGLRYIDLVYLMSEQNSVLASKAKWFRCRETHHSSEDNAPQLTSKGTEPWLKYWEPLNDLEPIYTPLLLADDAIITLMQSNQILITNDDGVVTAGFSGSNSGKKIRIWAGSQLPDDAPFRVDVFGALFSSNANITGKITATSGKIAGFNIFGNSLTNGPEFDNDACIIFRNDTYHTFAGIGGNILPATSAMRAVARFENEDNNDFWGLGRNIAMLLSAKNADINHAFLGSGNGNLDGWIGGYHYSKYTLNAANTIYNGYLKIAQNNKWVVYAIGKSSGITLPTLSEVRSALGIGSSTAFCVEFTIVADVLTQNNFHVYGRTQKKVTVNGSEQTPYYNGEYPTVVNQNGQRVDSWEMGGGDSITYLLIYDPNKSGSLDSTYSLMYSARIINYQR